MAVVVPLVGFVVGVEPADAAKRPPKARAVTGTYDGEAGFRFEGCSLVAYVSSGTYQAKHLGRGTYALNTCVDVSGPVHIAGTFALVTRRGAQLRGTIDASVGGGFDDVPVAITGGTRRFAGATGTLHLDVTMFDQRNCEPRVGICFDWSEHADITGTITKVRRPK
jgi:hypothetical protein